MNIQGERLKYFYATTIVTTIAIGIFLYNYYSSTKKNEVKKTKEKKKKFTATDEEKHDLSLSNININNIFQDALDFKVTSTPENLSPLKMAVDDEDPPTDLDGMSSLREEHLPSDKNKKKVQYKEVKERPKSKLKTPSKGIYGNTAIKDDDPIRKLLLKTDSK